MAWAWRGVGVGVNNMEKKKKYKSTAFSFESCIKGIEVHIPMYLRTANDLFRSIQKKHRHRYRHRQMVWTLTLHPFKLRNKGKEKETRRNLWLGMRRVMLFSLLYRPLVIHSTSMYRRVSNHAILFIFAKQRRFYLSSDDANAFDEEKDTFWRVWK